MQRSEILELMSELHLYGMKATYDEVMATAIKRQHEPQRIIADLLKAEINDKQEDSRNRRGQICTPIRGQICKPFDNQGQGRALHPLFEGKLLGAVCQRLKASRSAS